MEYIMLILLSPTKTQDFSISVPQAFPKTTTPHFESDAVALNKLLKKLSPEELQKLMKLSDSLTEYNVKTIKEFKKGDHLPALFAYTGMVYKELGALDFTKSDCDFAKKHIRILSGLYGVLSPTDRVFPYRLEMQTKLPNSMGKNLYSFWTEKITDYLKQDKESNIIINLLSGEYSKAIDKTFLKERAITINFKNMSGGKLKTIGTYSKQARGAFTRYIIKNSLTDIEQLKIFCEKGYQFSEEHSKAREWVFTAQE